QDLKDYMRKAGDVVFSEVDGRGRGMVEYGNKRDMKYAVEKLDDSEFRSRSERAYIRVREAARGRSGSRSASRSKSRSRSARRSSKKRSRSRSNSRSKSVEGKKAKRSASRSKSASKSPSAEEKEKKEEKKPEVNEDGKPLESESATATEKEDEKMEASEDQQQPGWAAMKDDELREELKKRGLDTEGEHAELVQRLEAKVPEEKEATEATETADAADAVAKED
ncbi:hypothetical protein BBJ28_00016674, partial [Nothophytophthora sp. Chile5]